MFFPFSFNFEVQQISIGIETLLWGLVIEPFTWPGVELAGNDIAVMLS